MLPNPFEEHIWYVYPNDIGRENNIIQKKTDNFSIVFLWKN